LSKEEREVIIEQTRAEAECEKGNTEETSRAVQEGKPRCAA